MRKGTLTSNAKRKRLTSASGQNSPLVETRYRQIVEGACRPFFRKGFHPTSIREIAEESGMSMGQLYHYISSKDDVLFLVHKHIQKMWLERLEHSGVARIKDPLKRFVTALRQTLGYISENKRLFQFLYSETKYLSKEHLRLVLEMDAKNVIGFWENLLRDIDKKGANKADEVFSASLVAYLMVFLALRGWSLKDRSQGDNIELLIDFIMKGLAISESPQ
jgi:AcrR family transcriptional regulator